MIHYFPKPFRSLGGNINVKVDLSNYAKKTSQKEFRIEKVLKRKLYVKWKGYDN